MNMERSSRFIPKFSSSSIYKSQKAENGAFLNKKKSNLVLDREELNVEPRVVLNGGTFYIIPESPDGISSVSSEHDSNEEEVDIQPNLTLPIRSEEKKAIAEALGFRNSSRVYELTSSNIQESNIPGRKNKYCILGLNDNPLSKDTRQNMTPDTTFSLDLPRKKDPITVTPEHNLEAPGLKDDFYCNLVSWSNMSNKLAVGLRNTVYTWCASNEVSMLYRESSISITAISFSNHDYFVIGTVKGEVLLLSQLHKRVLNRFSSTSSSIFSFEWLPDSKLFLAGTAKGDVLIFHLEDDRDGNPHLVLKYVLKCHQQQICGITLNKSCSLLAVGANDNSCSVWEFASNYKPKLKTILRHRAAVKALAFCPWADALLATGAGSNDRHLRFWHASTGTLLSSHPVNAQVTFLAWCKDKKEIIVSFGYGNSEKPLLLSVFSYPLITPLAQAFGNSYIRCLSACQSPNGVSVGVATSDAFIRIYKIREQSMGLSLSSSTNVQGFYDSPLIELYEGVTKIDSIR